MEKPQLISRSRKFRSTPSTRYAIQMKIRILFLRPKKSYPNQTRHSSNSSNSAGRSWVLPSWRSVLLWAPSTETSTLPNASAVLKICASPPATLRNWDPSYKTGWRKPKAISLEKPCQNKNKPLISSSFVYEFNKLF